MSSDEPLGHARQVGFYDALLSFRKTVLIDALQIALGEVDPLVIRQEIHATVSGDCLKVLARAGIRDEYVFPASTLIEHTPSLVGYYRLLLGIPQKTFYGGGSGMGRFKTLEQGRRGKATRAEIEGWCQYMSRQLCALILELASTLDPRDLGELQLMTLGQQIQGSRNNTLGRTAAAGVLTAVSALVGDSGVVDGKGGVTIRTPAGKVFRVAEASDPDISVNAVVAGTPSPVLAIEIKGGSDGSNVHNRAGKAEKSHLKSKQAGYPECWTVIASANHSLDTLSRESPSTDHWFDVLQVIAQEGESWQDFTERLHRILEL